MSAAEPERQFVDTNVLIYAHDEAAREKRERARSLLAMLWEARRGCLSMQVLQEFFVTVTQKTRQPMAAEDAAVRVREYSEWMLHVPERSDLHSAIEIHRTLRISFWDAMIIQSARRLRCPVLWSEDLSPGQIHAGVTVRNPFA